MDRRWIFVSLVICFMAAVLITGLASIAQAQEFPLSGKKICIDPGHGGTDPGAIYQFETIYLEEKEINLDVSNALGALLIDEGAEVFLTRTDNETYLTNNDRYTYCNGVGADLTVSMHTNSVTDQTWDGSLVLYFHDDDRVLAQAIHDTIYPYLRDSDLLPAAVDFRDFGLDRFASGVLLKTNMPAVIVEAVFGSHHAETVLLATPMSACELDNCRRAEIAAAVRDGIRAYYETSAPEPPPSQGGEMRVDALDMYYAVKKRQFFIYTDVNVVDGQSAPLGGVTVSLTSTLPDGTTVDDTAVTSSAGIAAFRLRSAAAGTYSSEVTNLAKDGYDYLVSAAGSGQVTIP